eukprot:1116897-Prorocentrum_minimum.AAC.3
MSEFPVAETERCPPPPCLLLAEEYEPPGAAGGAEGGEPDDPEGGPAARGHPQDAGGGRLPQRYQDQQHPLPLQDHEDGGHREAARTLEAKRAALLTQDTA